MRFMSRRYVRRRVAAAKRAAAEQERRAIFEKWRPVFVWFRRVEDTTYVFEWMMRRGLYVGDRRHRWQYAKVVPLEDIPGTREHAEKNRRWCDVDEAGDLPETIPDGATLQELYAALRLLYASGRSKRAAKK